MHAYVSKEPVLTNTTVLYRTRVYQVH